MKMQLLQLLAVQLMNDAKDAVVASTKVSFTTGVVATAVSTEYTAKSLAYAARTAEAANNTMENWLVKRYADRLQQVAK